MVTGVRQERPLEPGQPPNLFGNARRDPRRRHGRGLSRACDDPKSPVTPDTEIRGASGFGQQPSGLVDQLGATGNQTAANPV